MKFINIRIVYTHGRTLMSHSKEWSELKVYIAFNKEQYICVEVARQREGH